MKEAGFSFVRIDGSVSAPKRITAISTFNSDAPDAPRFILCSLLASGTGINLTRANWCFMMDVWWNEAVEAQAMDRSKGWHFTLIDYYIIIVFHNQLLLILRFCQSIVSLKPAR